jgi:hypothetical protein
MPKTGYVLSEKEVARVHASLDKISKEIAMLKSKFPVSSTTDSNAVQQPS